jgi:C1A family cysteine protease
MICGYVDNNHLPTNAPAGDGGGYFVVKNSWGTYHGDCGFVYLPYNYMRDYGTSMIALTGIRGNLNVT